VREDHDEIVGNIGIDPELNELEDDSRPLGRRGGDAWIRAVGLLREVTPVHLANIFLIMRGHSDNLAIAFAIVGSRPTARPLRSAPNSTVVSGDVAVHNGTISSLPRVQ
jgi:hypothetical protein